MVLVDEIISESKHKKIIEMLGEINKKLDEINKRTEFLMEYINHIIMTTYLPEVQAIERGEVNPVDTDEFKSQLQSNITGEEPKPRKRRISKVGGNPELVEKKDCIEETL